jgi:hypothetical protein
VIFCAYPFACIAVNSKKKDYVSASQLPNCPICRPLGPPICEMDVHQQPTKSSGLPKKMGCYIIIPCFFVLFSRGYEHLLARRFQTNQPVFPDFQRPFKLIFGDFSHEQWPMLTCIICCRLPAEASPQLASTAPKGLRAPIHAPRWREQRLRIPIHYCIRVVARYSTKITCSQFPSSQKCASTTTNEFSGFRSYLVVSGGVQAAHTHGSVVA